MKLVFLFFPGVVFASSAETSPFSVRPEDVATDFKTPLALLEATIEERFSDFRAEVEEGRLREQGLTRQLATAREVAASAEERVRFLTASLAESTQTLLRLQEDFASSTGALHQRLDGLLTAVAELESKVSWACEAAEAKREVIADLQRQLNHPTPFGFHSPPLRFHV